MYTDRTDIAGAPAAAMPIEKAAARRDRAKRSARKLAVRAALAARRAHAADTIAASRDGIDPVMSSEGWDAAAHGAFLVGVVLASLHAFEAEEAWRDAAQDASEVSYDAMAIAGQSARDAEEHIRHHAEARDRARASFKRAIAAVRPELRVAPAA